MSQIFGEFVASLNERKVRYLVDILIDRTDRNATATRDAIYDFFQGRPPETIDPRADLMNPDRVLQLGVPPNRIDVLNQAAGIEDFAAAWKRRRPGRIGETTASFVSLKDLLASKRAAGRPQDLADVAVLERRSGRPRSQRTGAKAVRSRTR